MNKRRSQGPVIGLIICLLAIAGLLAGGAALWNQKKDALSQVETARAEARSLAESHEKELAVREENFQTEIQRINEDWSQQMAELKEKQQRRIAGVHDQINRIVYNSDDTLEYINGLENKLRRGNNLAAEEIESLEMLSAGLTYLHRQYSKPLDEFKELEQYFASQMDLDAIKPDMRFAFLKRILSKNFRATEKDYFKDVGKSEAFEEARNKVLVTYDNAQRQMDALSLSYDNYLQSLQDVISNKEDNMEQLDEFFDSSRQILSIHREIMKLQEEPPPVEPAEPVTVKP